MPQAQSEVAICNQAIGKVGGTRITSFDDDTVEANLCKDLYAPVRDQVTEAHWWSHARKRVTLTPDPTQPVFGWDQKYLIPADCLRVWNVFDDGGLEFQTREWDREGPHIVANPGGSGTTLYVLYLSRVTDPTRFSALYTSALVARLSAEFSIPLAQSRAAHRAFWEEYGNKIMEAVSTDGQQGRSKGVRARKLLDARGRGGHGPFMYGPSYSS